MDETQMEPIVDAPEGWCSSFCDKVMKNMVLTLTILGTFLVWLLSLTIYPFATPTPTSQHTLDNPPTHTHITFTQERPPVFQTQDLLAERQ